jgi:hypothetical protein
VARDEKAISVPARTRLRIPCFPERQRLSHAICTARRHVSLSKESVSIRRASLAGSSSSASPGNRAITATDINTRALTASDSITVAAANLDEYYESILDDSNGIETAWAIRSVDSAVEAEVLNAVLLANASAPRKPVS